jgi:hypothetical protein
MFSDSTMFYKITERKLILYRIVWSWRRIHVELQAFKWRESLCCLFRAVTFDETQSALTSTRRVYHFCASEASEMIQKHKAPPYRHLDCQFISQSACKFFLFFLLVSLYSCASSFSPSSQHSFSLPVKAVAFEKAAQIGRHAPRVATLSRGSETERRRA